MHAMAVKYGGKFVDIFLKGNEPNPNSFLMIDSRTLNDEYFSSI